MKWQQSNIDDERAASLNPRRHGCLRARLGDFAHCAGGNVAMMFGLAVIGVIGATGLAIDFTRQSHATSALQSAIDSVALAVAKDVDQLNAAQLSAKAQAIFDGMTGSRSLAGLRLATVYTTSPNRSLSVSVDSTMPSLFGGLFGISSLPLKAGAVIPISTRPAEITLVMDNTGSMSGRNKMTELKKAATNLVNAMQSASASGGNEIRIALVPFAKSVKIGTGAVAEPWIDWSGYHRPQSNWTGCVDDRDQPHDVSATIPTNDPDTRYPASDCNLAPIMPMTNNWNALKTRIASMTANGNTNLTIGLAWGMNMMLPGRPLSAASNEPEKFNHYMILLTDGLNTQNRWTTSTVAIDARTLEACARVKAAGIKLFTVRVIEGNANLLRSCASSPEMFYDVSDASQLTAVFDQIGAAVKNALYLQR